MSLPAAAEIVSREDFLKFIKPFSVKVFEAISHLAPMNTAHVHGDNLYFDEVLDLPVAVFSWWDRGPGGPDLESIKMKTGKCVMGGIDQKIVVRNTRAFLKQHVREGRQLGGDHRFFLANGCSIDTWVCPGSVEAIVAAARESL
jgi:uroporphyrinogen decarboxylase